MERAHNKAGEKPGFAEYDYSNFYYGAGDDPLNLLTPFARWYRDALPNGYYLYQEALASAPTTRVRVRNGKTKEFQDLLNLASYNYLGISYRPEVKRAAAEAIDQSMRNLKHSNGELPDVGNGSINMAKCTDFLNQNVLR